MKSDIIKNIVLWGIIAIVLLSFFNGSSEDGNPSTNYSTFIGMVKNDEVIEVTILPGGTIAYTTKNGSEGKTQEPATKLGDTDLINQLLAKGVTVKSPEPQEGSILATIFFTFGPMLLFIGIWIWFMRKMQGGGKGGGVMGHGKSKAKFIHPKDIHTRFTDVAGCDESIAEVKEVVDFLHNPGQFHAVGAHIPRGILMAGPPGTGKTLLARAMAGEAGLPFFSTSGSEFVEMFVGVGASRVRDIFETAKKYGGAIIFIDEIDAIGKQRGAGMGGGHDEREQTLNQILVEMDGFDKDARIIVIAATNRPELLDKALTRPGRFDRDVTVGLPDVKGREAILRVHAQCKPLGGDVNLQQIAQRTPGMSGADLANVLNESAIMAARRQSRMIESVDIENAIDKIIMGPEKKSMVMTEQQRLETAWHEAAHALVGYVRNVQGLHDPVHAVSIMPRGGALGVTMYRPDEDRLGYSKGQLLAMVDSLLAGRLGELALHNGNELMVSTGASNDLERASDLVRRMIKEWGFSKEMGLLTAKVDMYGRQTAAGSTVNTVDDIAKKWLETANRRADGLVKTHKAQVQAMADMLMERETIRQEEIEELFGELREQYKDTSFAASF